jgi:hypothetical protein
MLDYYSQNIGPVVRVHPDIVHARLITLFNLGRAALNRAAKDEQGGVVAGLKSHLFSLQPHSPKSEYPMTEVTIGLELLKNLSKTQFMPSKAHMDSPAKLFDETSDASYKLIFAQYDGRGIKSTQMEFKFLPGDHYALQLKVKV